MVKLQRKQKQGFRAIFDNEEITSLEGTLIASFFPEAEEMTISELMERTNYSYERVNTGLKSLVEKKIVFEKRIGKTLVYWLDVQNLYADSMGFNAYMLGKEIEFIKKHKDIYQLIKEIQNNHYVWELILFGSYSKGTESKTSDIDIICLTSDEKEVKQFLSSLKHKFNKSVNPILMPPHEFPKIKSDNPELWNDIKLYGIVFKGGDSFYYWMYKDEKR